MLKTSSVAVIAIFASVLVLSLDAQGQATPPTISPNGATNTGPLYGVKVSSANAGTNIIACTLDGATPATNGLGTSVPNDGHSFALQNPGWLPIGISATLKCVAGTSLLADSGITSAAFTINSANVIPADAEGIQCQGNTPNCTTNANNIPTMPSGTPNRIRVWDALSPFYSEIPSQQGSNCNWAPIESNPALPGTYNFTCIDRWMAIIDDFRNGNNGYTAHPNYTAAWTFGMIPRAQVVTGIPGGNTGFSVTGLTNIDSLNKTLTYTGSFGSTDLSFLYVGITGMKPPGTANLPLAANGTGQGVITTWGASQIIVTVANTSGFATETGSTGTLKVSPGPKGMSIHPDDLPLQGGTTNWDGTPPSPGCSPSFHNFVVALVNHCSTIVGRTTECFYNEFNVVEGWNESNNNIFWNPNLNTLAQVNQMLECELPTIRNKMDGTGGTNKVSVQTVATTASAPATLQYLKFERDNGRISDVLAYHHYFSGNNPSAAPEAVIGTDVNIANQRATVAGWPNTPVRATEVSYQATQSPYGCSLAAPWTANDCYGQIVRYQILTASNGILGVDWYNLTTNCLKTPACSLVYSTMATLINGGTMAACSNSGASPHVIYQCGFTEAGGKTALWVWNYCLNDANYATCSANGSTFTVPGGGYTNYKDLNGGNTTITGATVNVTVLPLLFEQTPQAQSPAAPVLNLLE